MSYKSPLEFISVLYRLNPGSQTLSLPVSLQFMGNFIIHAVQHWAFITVLCRSQNHLPDLKIPLGLLSCCWNKEPRLWLMRSFAKILNSGLLHYCYRSPSLDLCNPDPWGGERGGQELCRVYLGLSLSTHALDHCPFTLTLYFYSRKLSGISDWTQAHSPRLPWELWRTSPLKFQWIPCLTEMEFPVSKENKTVLLTDHVSDSVSR